MKLITLFNTSICSENIGDFIIADAVKKQLHNIFPDDMIFETITQDKIHKRTYKLVEKSNFSFVGGTNLLSSDMRKYKQWQIDYIDAIFIKNITLLGVGWWQYQHKPTFYTRHLLKKVLSSDTMHSVRDSYTEKMLKNMGFTNVINTGCPTMWDLTKEHCDSIPHKKAQNVVFTLTDYNPDPSKDQMLIDILSRQYEKIYFWPQGSNDIAYYRKMKNTDCIHVLGGNLQAFDLLLSQENLDIDYIGTRLHGGIRALQNRRRTIIIGIDNRALEKSKDFNLDVISRNEMDMLEEKINSKTPTNIILKEENIQAFKRQFQ